MRRHFFSVLCAGVGTSLLASCAEIFPRFDNPLNPDIRLLRAGDVVDSVKCAVTSYLYNRALKVIREGHEKAKSAGCQIEPRWQFTYRWIDNKSNTEAAKRCRETNDCQCSDLPAGKGIKQVDTLNCSPGYEVWAYQRAEKGMCVRNGGCPPGTIPSGRGKCVLDDDSRFALDPTSDVTIDLTLTANNTGDMHYTRLDADGLGWLSRIVVPGGVGGAPFPSLRGRKKDVNAVQVKATMPQTFVVSEAKLNKSVPREKVFLDKIYEARKKAKTDQDVEAMKDLLLHFQKTIPRASRVQVDVPQYTAQALRALQEEGEAPGAVPKFKQECSRHKIDYLALEKLIHDFVARQEAAVFSGGNGPDVALDELVLTTSFQIMLDASAGTEHVFRIVPLVGPPTLTLSADHTHQLKLTFRGVKNRGNPRVAASLLRRCLTRLAGVRGSRRVCERPEALLLESIVDAVESSRGGQ
jgi:hypothetical protein